jgi:type IV pilus assembly protein PilY1
MTPTIKNKFLQILNIGLFAVSIGSANAALTDLGTAPLVSATTSEVLPNLMYILDNSGSMGRDYMPDYIIFNNKCKSDTSTSGAFSAACEYGDPPYNASEFNSIYYNPETLYSPAVNADGTSKTSMTSANTAGWTVVPRDALTGSGGNQRLVPNAGLTDGYPDIVWCNTSTGVTTAVANDPSVCKKNSQYIYPNVVSGNPSASFNQDYNVFGYPFYYTVSAGEYCTNKNLTSCITATAPTATHTFPAKIRWCTSAANVLSGSGCQGKYSEVTDHEFIKWAGIVPNSLGRIKILPETTACGAAGQPSCVSPTPMTVATVTVDGVRIIPLVPSPALTIANTTLAAQRNTLAANIATAINTEISAPDYTAVALGDVVEITPVAAGAFTGTIAFTTATPYPTAVQLGNKATGSLTIDSARTTSSVTGIRVGTTQILGATINVTGGSNNSASRNALANALVSQINSFVSSPDFTATSNGASRPVITITAVNTGAANNLALTYTENDPSGRLSITPITGMSGGTNDGVKNYTIPNLITQFSSTPVVTTFQRVDVLPATTFTKAASRTDCAGTVCSYDEEMTNFANWYSYYRTRMQMMKSSTSLAFKTIDTRFRVGFITINGASSNYLSIAQYAATQKADWYTKLFATIPSGSTPLRRSLSTVGRIFAGKGASAVGNASDPVQYSCQQNFTILTTDGYWFSDPGGLEVDGSTAIGNMDGGTTPRPMYEGPVATTSSNSLADGAKYYYDTDLRTSALGNCTGALGAGFDVCTNNVFVTTTDNNLKQHMTTFTLGLGVDASLTYTSDYKTADEGDFYELMQGTRDWPKPIENTQTAVDDLWHAAVNGQGTYFSAKNPNQLSSSLSEALSSIKAKVGAGAAAATSTLNPVSGDNFTYVASYTSVKWIGNLESRTVNTDTGKVNEDATWCLENVIADTCAAPSSVVASTAGGSTTYQCVTPSSTASTCSAPGVLDGTDCKVEVSTSCTGTMQDFVSDTNDTRNVYMNVAGTLASFTSGNLVAVGKDGNFDNSFLSTNLSQWSSLSTAQRVSVNSASLVNFLRGNNGFEDRASNVDGLIDNRIYRLRETVLGDLVDSTPVYVGAPKANFSDPGYGPNTSPSSFKTAQATREGTVYIGANDGMLHAINATNGQERWAYVPTMVLDNMWKLADKNYGNGVSHSYYVNGDIVVNDICTASCTSATTAVWRTILVGGLNGGGQGYFALDVTNPATPTLLWEFDTADDGDMGYSYGNPIITKKADGTWVALVTSGYNNTGTGYMYVLNATTGAVISKYSTGVGSATTPSGLAKINAYIADGVINNTAVFVYGGDLLGNLWRFDINSAQSATNPFKVAVLKDPSGNPQPITVRPELADISGKRVLYVGTGRYLGTSDLTNTQQQTIYAISDDATSTPATLDNPRTSSAMVNQVLVNDTLTATRSMQTPSNPVSFTTDRGWYIDFPDSGERQNVPAQLVFGTLLLPTTVPSNTVCSPGGYGWLNFLDYRTGAAVSGNVVASRTNAPIVGINVLYVKGKPVVNIVTADNPTPSFPPVQPSFTGGSQSGFTNHRVIWRELIEDQ